MKDALLEGSSGRLKDRELHSAPLNPEVCSNGKRHSASALPFQWRRSALSKIMALGSTGAFRYIGALNIRLER